MKQEAPQQRRKPPWESSDFQSEEHVKALEAVRQAGLSRTFSSR